jgi:tetratricopeptide (TPR) repeat protein
MRQGKPAEALAKADQYLAGKPKDPQMRFLRGVILTEQGKANDAIAVFTKLTEDYPELPEPYNNLAVLYASQGNYDKAKSALELAIHTHPSYATAQENLGDIYAQLESRAYDRALQLDKNNTTAQLKLSMVKEIFSKTGGQRPPTAPVKTEPPVPPAKPAVTAAAKPAEKPVEKPPVAPAPAPTKSSAPPASAAVTPAAPAASAAPAAGGDDKAAITAAIEDWARAWSRKDVAGYLAHYAADFDTPKGASRKSWERERRERIERPKSIEVDVTVRSVKINGNEATAIVRQSYKSDITKTNSTKTLRMEKNGDRWLIKQEKVGG